MNAVAENIKEMGTNKILALGGVGVLLLGFFAFISMGVSSTVMSPVYMGMSQEDSAYVLEALEKNKIPYEVSTSGSQVLVPSDKVGNVRVLLAQSGLPSKGSMTGYEIFDKTEALGTSNFVLNINKLRALEGELGRTISSFSKVASARVHLVIPKRELFKKNRQETKGSIAIKLKSFALDNNEIAAIRHLVATAVPDLKPENITIVDNKGHLLARGAEDGSHSALAQSSQEYRQGYEKKVKETIESMLERSVGFGKVTAEVTADIDFDRVVTNSEIYDPEGQVARSIQGTEEIESSDESENDGTVSVGQNLPDANGAKGGGINNTRKLKRIDETTNFEISKTVENHVKESGTVKRLSVAVMVDGTYRTDTSGNHVYVERTDEELKQIRLLVESAIGYDEERGDALEIINMKFARAQIDDLEPSPLAWLKDDLDSIIQTLVLGGVIILVLLLIVKPLVARAIAASETAQREGKELENSLLSAPSIMGQLPDLTEEDEEEEMINISRVKGGVKSSTYRRVMSMIDQNPEETVNILRMWTMDE